LWERNETGDAREVSASTVIKNQVEFLPLYRCCFNAQGLVSKFLQLHDFLSSVNVDIVSISETWLDSSVKDSEFVPNGYKLFRQNRDLNFYTQGTYTRTSREGTLLLVKDYLNPTLIDNCTSRIMLDKYKSSS
jgi:hypothetical protein